MKQPCKPDDGKGNSAQRAPAGRRATYGQWPPNCSLCSTIKSIPPLPGLTFNLSSSKAHTQLYELSPLLHKTLVQLELMPAREFATFDELMTALDGIDQTVIDATAPRGSPLYHWPQEATAQHEHYSGKKQHIRKNTIIATTAKVILFVGRTIGERYHGYRPLKSELPPTLEWFTFLTVLVDLGYFGIQRDYAGEWLLVPHKKPRKGQHNPTPPLTDAQRADNQALGSLRVTIEHALAGLKRYNILVHRFRNRRITFHDDVIAISAALWNFSLIY